MRHTLLFFGDHWDLMWRRRQQLAWRLAQTNLVDYVIYVERPLPATSFFKFLLGSADQDGMDRWRRVLRNHSWLMPISDKLSVLTTFAPLPSIRSKIMFQSSEWMRDQWLLREFRKHLLNPELEIENQKSDLIVWVSHPQISINVIQALNPRLLWYDCTEDFAAWPGLPDCVRRQIKDTDQWLTERADVVTAVSRTLYEEKRQVNPNAHWLPNAVDTDLFLQPKEMFPVPQELHGKDHPILTFVGGLSEWAHDWELLGKVATLRPQWTILLIGGLSVSQRTRQMLADHSNILCIGQKTYQELPGYLVHSDICFQYYGQERGNDTRNSQKLFLYLAAGKPVISTSSADVSSYLEHVHLADDPESFVAAMEKALQTDSPEKTHRRQKMAKANSWTVRVKQIGEILKAEGYQ